MILSGRFAKYAGSLFFYHFGTMFITDFSFFYAGIIAEEEGGTLSKICIREFTK